MQQPTTQHSLARSLGRKSSFALWLLLLLNLLVILPGCVKQDPPAAGAPSLKLVLDNIASPLGLLEVPDGSKRLFVIDQPGRIWIIGADGNRMTTPFIDVSSKMIALNANGDERGLLGLAFHPNYQTNGRFFVYYNAPPRAGGPTPTTTWNNTDRVSEFKVSASNPNVADLGSEKIILDVDDPQSNHNGGTIAFGKDGYLYISIGDGGGANDVGNGHVSDWYAANAGGNGQDIYANLLGNMLRIDVNSGSPYGIPADNPYVGKPGLDEIYAIGLRNTYRFSFDMGGTNQIFGGDAGQNLYEEVNIISKGGNYGWNIKEGSYCFNAASPLLGFPTCVTVDSAGNPLLDPIIQFPTITNPIGGVGTTVIGGNVYRGKSIPQYNGKYIFGSYSQRRNIPDAKLYIANKLNKNQWTYEDIFLQGFGDNLGQYLKGFGQDLDGEVYLTTTGLAGPVGTTGKVYKLVFIP
ncbi:MAG: PQQ-dependent sugar dehydrogenase [Chitinophagaceae bacterium]